MLLIDILEVKPEMVLAGPVAHPRTGEHTLLKAGFQLNTNIIQKLKALGVPALWVHQPDLDFLDKYLGTVIPKSRSRIFHTIKDSFTKLSKRVSTRLPVGDYILAVNDLMLALLSMSENAVYTDRLAGGSDELFVHSSNVSYFSMVIALKIRWYIGDQRSRLPVDHAQDVTNLGIGAMLHDFGKLTLPKELQACHGIDPAVSENNEYRRHTVAGFGLVQWRVEPSAAQILLNHHQRYDGSGYPEIISRQGQRKSPPLVGQQIHIFSRIVTVANVFDALLGDHEDASAAEALYRLRSPEFEGWFDPFILDTFLKTIPSFPLGHVVTLADGRRAAVIGLNSKHPCKPVVRILDVPEPIDLNLAYHPDLKIKFHLGQRVDQFSFELPKQEANAPPWMNAESLNQ